MRNIVKLRKSEAAMAHKQIATSLLRLFRACRGDASTIRQLFIRV